MYKLCMCITLQAISELISEPVKDRWQAHRLLVTVTGETKAHGETPLEIKTTDIREKSFFLLLKKNFSCMSAVFILIVLY